MSIDSNVPHAPVGNGHPGQPVPVIHVQHTPAEPPRQPIERIALDALTMQSNQVAVEFSRLPSNYDGRPVVGIGSRVRDAADGSDTTMKGNVDARIDQERRSYDAMVRNHREDWERRLASYHENVQGHNNIVAANRVVRERLQNQVNELAPQIQRAESAAGHILNEIFQIGKNEESAKAKRAWSITGIVLGTIALIGVIATSIVTQTWPILFAAIPLVAGVGVSSVFTGVFSRGIKELSQKKNALNQQPEMQQLVALRVQNVALLNQMPIDPEAPRWIGDYREPAPFSPQAFYNPQIDLELKSTRNRYMQEVRRDGLNSNRREEIIIHYALLDEEGKSYKTDAKGQYYAAYFSLRNHKITVDREKTALCGRVDVEYQRCLNELTTWKRQQEQKLERVNQQIQVIKQRRDYRSTDRDVIDGEANIRRMRESIQRLFDNKKGEIDRWKLAEMNRVNGIHQEVVADLNQRLNLHRQAAFA